MISIQFFKQRNSLIDEELVQPRIVNMQTVGFNDWCVRMANGSTVTAADVAAVMQQIEDKLPEILSLNAKVICSPGGLTFRPKVSGSITQSELKARLTARKAAETDPEKAAKIDPDRALTTSDLTISDCTVNIEVDLPKDWSDTFKRRAELKRVKSSGETGASGDEGNSSQGSGSGGSDSGTGTNSGGNGNSGTGGGESPAVAAPTINGNTAFTDTTQVTISAESGAEIRYTTDGSTPTASSSLYESALTLSDTTTVKAIAIKDGVSSSVASKTFTKGSGGSDNGDND